jgi:hypothetical protein
LEIKKNRGQNRCSSSVISLPHSAKGRDKPCPYNRG